MTADNTDASSKLVGLVSLVQLIASPAEYDGNVVAVIGFLRLEFEGNELYLGRDDYRYAVTKNGLGSISLPT